MKVLLLKEIKGLGHTGEIKDVSEGYARNLLLPKNLAKILTKQDILILEVQKKKKEKQKNEQVKNKLKLAKKLNKKSFAIAVKADAHGTLYSGVDKKFVAKVLTSEGYQVEPEEVDLAEPIKKTGVYDVDLNLNRQKISIKINIASEL
jgi:large subunit ribosomal protein L9